MTKKVFPHRLRLWVYPSTFKDVRCQIHIVGCYSSHGPKTSPKWIRYWYNSLKCTNIRQKSMETSEMNPPHRTLFLLLLWSHESMSTLIHNRSRHAFNSYYTRVSLPSIITETFCKVPRWLERRGRALIGVDCMQLSSKHHSIFCLQVAGASILGWMGGSRQPQILEWGGRGLVTKYYCILIISYTLQE